jgi:hypothetical protein
MGKTNSKTGCNPMLSRLKNQKLRQKKKKHLKIVMQVPLTERI